MRHKLFVSIEKIINSISTLKDSYMFFNNKIIYLTHSLFLSHLSYHLIYLFYSIKEKWVVLRKFLMGVVYIENAYSFYFLYAEFYLNP